MSIAVVKTIVLVRKWVWKALGPFGARFPKFRKIQSQSWGLTGFNNKTRLENEGLAMQARFQQENTMKKGGPSPNLIK